MNMSQIKFKSQLSANWIKKKCRHYLPMNGNVNVFAAQMIRIASICTFSLAIVQFTRSSIHTGELWACGVVGVFINLNKMMICVRSHRCVEMLQLKITAIYSHWKVNYWNLWLVLVVERFYHSTSVCLWM